MAVWVSGLQSCHLRFLKKKILKNKKTMPVTDGVSHCARYFFSLLISATHVFSLELSSTQLLSFLLFTL